MTLNAFGAHTYAGGLAQGVGRHFNLTGLGEHDGYGDAIKALNFPNVPLYPTYDSWPRERGRGSKRTHFIFANPPCAPFSLASAGRSTKWHEDPRLNMFHDIFKMLPQVEPDVMAIESVTQAWIKGREMANSLAKDAAGMGYSTTVLLHNAKHVGNVQSRKRVFFVFHKVAVDWEAPNFDSPLKLKDILKKVRVPAATRKKYPKVILDDYYRNLWEHTNQGGTLHTTFNKLNPNAPRCEIRGVVKGRPGFLWTKLNNESFAPVFIGGNHILHPTEPRALYPEEIGAIVGFPPDWKWPDNYDTSKISVFASQGVSPDVGAWLAEGIATSIERGKRINRPQYWIRDELRDPVVRDLLSDDPASMKVLPFDLPAMPAPKPERVAKDGTPKEPRIGRQGSGAYIRELLQQGLPTDKILALNKARFPESKASVADVSWNIGKLREQGITVRTR